MAMFKFKSKRSTEKVQKQHYSNILEVYPFPYVQKFGHATPITVAM